MGGRRGKAGLGAAAFVLVLGAISSAWACTIVATSVGVSPPAAPERSAVRIQGTSVTSGLPVEVRWNSVDGPILGTAVSGRKGEFVVEATVPASIPGMYALVAVAPDQAGVGRAAFQITEPPVPLGESMAAPVPAQSDAWLSGQASATTGSSGILAGLGLAGVGLVGLFGGLMAKTLRKRATNRI